MKGKLDNPSRYKTISEMNHNEVWYISLDSLRFDIEEKTGESIYVVFHYDPYSSIKNISPNEESHYDVKITCKIKGDTKSFYIIHNTEHIRYIDLTVPNKRLYTILDTKNEIIDIFDAEKNDLDDEELYDEFLSFIETALENLEETEKNDKKYSDARINFSKNIMNYSNGKNRENIKNILYNITLLSKNRWTHQEVLDNLSNITICKQYIEWFANTIQEWHIDDDILSIIDSIALRFDKTFTAWTTKDDKEKDNNLKIEQLKKDLEISVEEEDYDKASKIRDELERLWYKENDK